MGYFGKERHYYHASIRRYVVLFGSIFDDLYIKRDNVFIKVPIQFGRTNTYESVAQDVESRERKRIKTIVPSMAFTFEDMQHDTTRKSTSFARPENLIMNEDETLNYQSFAREPWNFTFKLDIITKNTDDMLQIIEQILPVFKPTLTIRIDDIDATDMSFNQNIVVTLDSVSMDDNFDSDDEGRLIRYTLSFNLKGFLYHKTKTGTTIAEVIYKTYTDLDGETEVDIATYFTTKFKEDVKLNAEHYSLLEKDLFSSLNSEKIDDIADPKSNGKRTRSKNN